MLWVDNRVGSADLAEPLSRMGLPVDTTRLQFGDIMFEGKGNDDTTVLVGVELKKLPDLMQSLRDGRLAGYQLPGMLKAYDYRFLLVEGTWKPNKQGQLLVPGRHGQWQPAPSTMSVSELEKRVLTLELLGGLHVRHCTSRFSTLHFLSALYRWFTDQSMDRHTTHIVDHQPLGFIELSEFRAVVQKFPGIGIRTSLAVEMHFGGSLRAACNAPADEWADIVHYVKGKPRRIGLKVGQQIETFCRGVK